MMTTLHFKEPYKDNHITCDSKSQGIECVNFESCKE